MLCRILLVWAVLAAFACRAATEHWAEDFRDPPPAARPHVFWYWMNGNISREGITADLEGMRCAGIGGAMIFNIGGHGIEGPVKVHSSEWRDLMRHAIRKAGELGIEVTLNNSMAGWSSSGGPWITPAQAMQRVTWSETSVEGGAAADLVLPQPPMKLDTYRDIAVLAFPTPAAEQRDDPAPEVTASDAGFVSAALHSGPAASLVGENWDDVGSKPSAVAALAAASGQDAFVQLAYAEPFPARSLHVAFARGQSGRGALQTSQDGRQWREVRTFEPRNLAPVDLAFECPPARFWRLVFPSGGKAVRIGLTALELRASYRIDGWTGKAMFDAYGLDNPTFSFKDVPAPAEAAIPCDRMVDLSSRMDAAGRLTWDVPAGRWTILRFGYTPTGSKVGPAHESGKGLECDKLSKEALELHWANSLQPWFDDPGLSPLVQYVHVDSYERGAQNWTARMPESFREIQGYDLRMFLPVLTGRVVASAETSERFLWDFRNVLTRLMHENYFGHMRELCRRNGKQLSCEPYHQTQFNNVTAGGQADIPMCEAWMGPGIPGPYWMKLGASPAHVYGKRLVACESFTSNKSENKGDWHQTPWDLKLLGDAILCGGVNRFVLHVSGQQPWTNAAPGLSVGICGQPFHRGNTWWPVASGWTRYLARCQHLLRQGTFVADALFSCGENSPSESLNPGGAMSVPRGYDYDVCDPQVILTRLSVKDGRLTLPDGMSYRLLVLPDGDNMTVPMIRRICELVSDGATVIGPKPLWSPGLAHQAAADAEVRKRADEVWCGGKVLSPRTPLKDTLAALRIAPDFETRGGKALVRFIHRRLEDGELYFVANAADEPQSVEAVFRVSATCAPQLWDPVTGAIRDLPEFSAEKDGRTAVPLRFEPRQAFFVVFQKRRPRTEDRGQRSARNFDEVKPLMALTGAWQVTFDPKWGGPGVPVTFNDLSDWTDQPDPHIRYYSGTAVYRKTFDLPSSVLSPPSSLFLDLGVVKSLARVTLNGRDLGTVWCAPWRVEIPQGALNAEGNALEIAVVNTWPNRMIGDEQLPLDYERSKDGTVIALPAWLTGGVARTSGRLTFASLAPYMKGDSLLPSGLLGPVTIQSTEKTDKP